jgi:hypothetical protein
MTLALFGTDALSAFFLDTETLKAYLELIIPDAVLWQSLLLKAGTSAVFASRLESEFQGTAPRGVT